MKPALLFYCQHSVGIGHLMRSFTLAGALSEDFRVVFLNGGRIPAEARIPPGVEVIDLPPLGMEDGHNLISRGEYDVTEAKSLRRARVQAVFDQIAPRVLFIELFPFGRKKFAFELLPLLKQARRGAAPLVLSSVRDILVSARPDQQHHDDRAAWLCKRYFDAVLVHADPKLARFEESFRPRRPLAVPLHYTGFVAPRAAAAAPVRERTILVSAGGGLVGMPLMQCALQAHALLPEAQRWPLRIVAGPFLPPQDWERLQQLAAGQTGVSLLRSVPDLAAEMRRAGVSLSQCGYNTAMDIATSAVPALVVPYALEREDEQLNRAGRLAQLGTLRMLAPSELTPQRLAQELHATMQFQPRAHSLDLRGAQRSAAITHELWVEHVGARTDQELAHVA